eukprot:maker-scaffold278_size225338-snap-gene-1.25 protein:Tk03816 transcript:maker-scaffold278_size225338-snap-gene-1.25-mRNA-1 annotation:"trna mitochondrial"
MRKFPVVVILGATGAGKSKLALEVAQHFKGEIISADAMQMYKGLDIVTNKVTSEELKLVPHHVIDYLDPLTKCTVVDFRNKALPIVESLLRQNVMPVICGGTNYYIESLLWRVLIDQNQDRSTASDIPSKVAKLSNDPEDGQFQGSLSSARDALDTNLEMGEFEPQDSTSTEDLYVKLLEIDPQRAKQLMPQERRKILRSLQVFHQNGRRHSDLIQEQRDQVGGSYLGGPLRFKENCLIIWVQCDPNILEERCNKRVDKMIQRGMVQELEQFHQDYNLSRKTPADYTIGIFQSIGFKEFHDYLMLGSQEEKASLEGQRLFEAGVDQLKLVTRQYARRQVKWMRSRFLNPRRDVVPVYPVSSCDPSQWDSACLKPALGVIEAFMEGRTPPLKPIDPIERAHEPEELATIHHCELCQVTLKGILQYQFHLASKRHRGLEKRTRTKEQQFYLVKILQANEDPEDKIKVLRSLKELSGMGLSKIKEHLSNPELTFSIQLKDEDVPATLEQLKNLGLIVDMKVVPK